MDGSIPREIVAVRLLPRAARAPARARVARASFHACDPTPAGSTRAREMAPNAKRRSHARAPSRPPSRRPTRLVQVLPEDPTDQLELAHRIANLAFVGKVQELERECATLQSQALDRASKIKSLERKLGAATEELDDAREKAASAIEEQSKLAQEKNALINTVKKLNRDNAKLDAFKRNLMQTLHDEEEDDVDWSEHYHWEDLTGKKGSQLSWIIFPSHS